MSLEAPTLTGLRETVHDAAKRARVAGRTLATLSTVTKDRALHAAADAVLAHAEQIITANGADLETARAAGTSDAMLDRLALNPSASTASPPACDRWPGCPTRSVRCCADAPCPTG